MLKCPNLNKPFHLSFFFFIKMSLICALFINGSPLSGPEINSAWGIEKIEADAKAVQVINHFMHALQLEDPVQKEKAVAALLHKSLLDKAGMIAPSTKRFSYQKASDNVKFYKVPVQITEVHKGRSVLVGFKETQQRGRIDKYFVAKREGIAGVPAPLHIFWPETGESPKLINIGSL